MLSRMQLVLAYENAAASVGFLETVEDATASGKVHIRRCVEMYHVTFEIHHVTSDIYHVTAVRLRTIPARQECQKLTDWPPDRRWPTAAMFQDDQTTNRSSLSQIPYQR